MINVYYSITIKSKYIKIDISQLTKYVKVEYKYKRGQFNIRVNRIEDEDCIEITPLIEDSNLSEFIKTCIFITKEINQRKLDINLYILIEYKNQCNYELSIEELTLINELGCYITLSCYESDEMIE